MIGGDVRFGQISEVDRNTKVSIPNPSTNGA